jgi:hypothetical protein
LETIEVTRRDCNNEDLQLPLDPRKISIIPHGRPALSEKRRSSAVLSRGTDRHVEISHENKPVFVRNMDTR